MPDHKQDREDLRREYRIRLKLAGAYRKKRMENYSEGKVDDANPKHCQAAMESATEIERPMVETHESNK